MAEIPTLAAVIGAQVHKLQRPERLPMARAYSAMQATAAVQRVRGPVQGLTAPRRRGILWG